MSLEAEINKDIKAAMLAKEREKLEALRAVKAALIVEKTKDGSTEVAEAVEIKLIQKLRAIKMIWWVPIYVLLNAHEFVTEFLT